MNSARLDTVRDMSILIKNYMNYLIDPEYPIIEVISALDRGEFSENKRTSSVSPQRQFLMDKLAKATDEKVKEKQVASMLLALDMVPGRRKIVKNYAI